MTWTEWIFISILLYIGNLLYRQWKRSHVPTTTPKPIVIPTVVVEQPYITMIVPPPMERIHTLPLLHLPTRPAPPIRLTTPPIITKQPTEMVVRSDNQNVHDSVLIRHLGACLDNLPKPTQTSSQAVKEIRDFLNQQGESPLCLRALQTLDTMERNTTPLSSLKLKEVDVLNTIWGMVEKHSDRDTRRQVLVERLAESSEEGSCATGRVARVVDSLSGVDDRVVLKPTWALRRELLDKAAVMAREHDGSQPLVDKLRSVFTKEYVDTGLVPAARLKAEIDEWGAYVE